MTRPPTRFPRRWRNLAATPFLLVSLGGCFSYSATPLGDVVPAQQARLTLDEDAFGRVMNQAAVEGFAVQTMNVSGNRISGRVASVSPESLTIQLRGAGASVLTAQVATGSIREAAVRRFDRTNTIVAVAASAGAMVLMIQGGVIAAGTQNNPDVDPENMTGLRLLSIPVP